MAPRRLPKRITLDLDEDTHRRLAAARFEDGITMAERLRALVSLWSQDEALARRVTERARLLAREKEQGSGDT